MAKPFPDHANTITSEVEFADDISEVSGLAFNEGAFDAKPILNSLASRGHIPIVKLGR